MNLNSYLPQDRLRAMARSKTLPDHTTGSVLFTDISGFTALTESLHKSLGVRLGAEELSRRLGAAYSVLIAEIEKYGGSVIGFAGDSMMCWFNSVDGGQGSGRAAVMSALGMQSAIQMFPELGLKVTIASGAARRFVVGDHDIQKLDVLVGATVARASTAEHHALRGDVLLDEVTAQALGGSLTIKEWREDEDTQEHFAVISNFTGGVDAVETNTVESLSNEILKSWVHHVVFERETSGSTFLTEFRPCVALFIRFIGIDYDLDSAVGELDAFIRQVQKIASRYDGTLMDITIGDKGSYAYLNFGALAAHEDDARRAVKAALELRNKTELQLQMGITQGLMRVGAYGGVTRKTFGALGDDVNLAARLMTTASESEILVSGHVHKAVRNDFTFEPRLPLPMKGKVELLPVFAMTGESQKRAIRLQEPNYALPMVGRVDELKLIEDKLDLAATGKSQVVAVIAEAGLGKSRLVAEVIRNARRKGFVGYGSACQSDAIQTPYHAWKSIWGAFFDVDYEQPLRKIIRNLEGEIEDRAPERVGAMPLLNVVLDLNIPENDFTQNLEPKIRQSALHALLEACLKAAAKDEPLLIVIEDLHWVDALSHDLLEQLAKALAYYPVCFVLAYRPPQIARLEAPRLEALEQFTRVELHELTQTEAGSAIRAKLAQLYPSRGGSLPIGLVDILMARAQGNPFYLEELLNYLHDRSIDPSEIDKVELPDSLHTLILSRIDQLSEAEKTTLRVASIVGRLFRARWLTGYYPELGAMPAVKASLDTLESLEITPLDSSEPELAYLFKHIVTHEVTYESLPFATRAKLHERLARYLENAYPEALPLEALAFHYGRSDNTTKQIEYLRKAGEAAQKNFANDAALDFYGKLLFLLKDKKTRIEIYMQRGQVLELMGQWGATEAEADYRVALNMATDEVISAVAAQLALGRLCRLRGEYEAALEWLTQARAASTTLADTGLAQKISIEMGTLLWRKGEYVLAHQSLLDGLALARAAADKSGIALALHSLGTVAQYQGNNAEAQVLYEESLGLKRELSDKQGIAATLITLGNVAVDQGNHALAENLYKSGLKLKREMSDKKGISAALHNLGNLASAQGDYAVAQSFYYESLALAHEMGDKRGRANTLGNLGLLAYLQGDTTSARDLYQESLALCKEMEQKTSTAYALFGLGLVGLADLRDELETHKNILESLRLRQQAGEKYNQTSSLVGVAGLALREDTPQLAAQLLGAVSSALKTLNVVLEADIIHFHTQTLAAVREQVGEAAFQSAFEEGSQWSLEEAVRKALEA